MTIYSRPSIEKNCLILIKVTVTDQLKIIHNKIKANQAQSDLDKLAAKTSALPSGELRKYEYLTGEDIGYQPSVLKEKKFDYSLFGKTFTKGLDKEGKEGGLLKRLKNIENAQKILDKSEYDEDEDENKKTERDIYQGSIEGMKGLKLPVETEIKDEESQMYLKNNLNQIKNFFSIFMNININIKGFSIILLMKKKRVLTTKHFHLKLKVLTFLMSMVLCMSS